MQNTDKLGRDGFYIQKYKLHVMKPIYPNKDLDFKEQKEDLRRRDYELRVKKFEEVYNRKIDYNFNEETDIAGWN